MSFSIFGKNSILDLIKFLDLLLLNHIATRWHCLPQQTGLQEKHDTVEDDNWAVGAKDSVNDDFL